MPGTTIPRGNMINSFVIAPTLTPVAVGANTAAEQSFTILGLQVGDQISAMSFNGAYTVNVDVANLRVSAANTLTISYQNNTGSSVTPPAGVYLIEINRLENSFAQLPATAF